MSQHNRKRIGLAALSLCLFLTAGPFLAAACGEALTTPTTTPTVNPALGPVVILNGILARGDLTGISGAAVMAAGADVYGQGIVIGPDGIPLNPEGLVGEKGEFKLVLPKSFLGTVNYEIKLVLIPTSGYPYDLLDLNGKPLVITIGEAVETINLGAIPIQ